MTTFSFGIADHTRHFAAFRHLPSGIEAVDLRDGHRLWRSDVTAMPLAIAGEYLLARLLIADTDILEFVILDVRNGRSVRQAEAFLLPHSISTSDAGFTVNAEATDHGFVVFWSAVKRYVGGAPPPRDLTVTNGTTTGGTLDIDATTGAIRDLRQIPSAVTRPPDAVSIDSTRLELTDDYVVIAREEASGKVLWQHPLGVATAGRPPLPQ